MKYNEKYFHLTENTEPMGFEEFQENVKGWAKRTGVSEADPVIQGLKMAEEAGEVAGGLARARMDTILDGIADVIVTHLNLLATLQNDLIKEGYPEIAEKATIETAFGIVWNEIKDRRGLMVNGAFVKYEDLTEEQKEELHKREEA